MIKKYLSGLVFLLMIHPLLYAQDLKTSGGEILHQLKKLQNPTRVLYLAAHPDDENTRMIAWLVNGVGAQTAYMALTRGDGGQNLIGMELGSDLGVLRTQELMQARKIDGGQQYFSRAVDFGYSKTASETLDKWGKKNILSDVVWVIRKFRPDVIITRFPPDERAGHGHHTASAMLGIEAFKLAADSSAFPDQLQYVSTWQPTRIYWNASVWWDKDLDSIAKNDSNYVSLDDGGYNPVMGVSYGELASYSRSQHKSQGFGVSVSRGSSVEYLKYLAGNRARGSIFDGINPHWERYNFSKGDKALARIIENFDPSHPEKSLPSLFKLRSELDKINDPSQRQYFRKQLDEIILKSIGWHAELLAEQPYFTIGTKQQLKLEVINPSTQDVVLKSLAVGEDSISILSSLSVNELFSESMEIKVSGRISQPYWLENPGENLFRVEDQQMIGKPENDAALSGKLTLTINGMDEQVSIPVRYKYSDRVEGEIIRPVFIMPRAVVNSEKENLVFVKDQPQTLTYTIRYFKKEPLKLHFESPGWKVEPAEVSISPDDASDFVSIQVKVSPTDNSRNEPLKIRINDQEEALSLHEISYSHIEDRVVFEPAIVNLIKIDLKKRGLLVGYIPGAGDKVAEAIQQMGYEVDILTEDMIRNNDLSNYKAIVAGIRAYNTQDWLPSVKPKLMEYIQNGGNYIVQYNTASRDLLSKDIGPYPFEISRERVTEEDAQPFFLQPDSQVFNKPNKIGEGDFEGWVQERGLYFADEWAEQYSTPLGWHDAGEPMRKGGLLIANYGKGAFIYTGISFFRELPAGVPGAYRLFANLLGYKNPAATSNEQ